MEDALKIFVETIDSIEAIFKFRRLNKYFKSISDERLKYIKSSKEVSTQWPYEISLYSYIFEGRCVSFPDMIISYYYFDPEFVVKYVKRNKDDHILYCSIIKSNIEKELRAKVHPVWDYDNDKIDRFI